MFQRVPRSVSHTINNDDTMGCAAPEVSRGIHCWAQKLKKKRNLEHGQLMCDRDNNGDELFGVNVGVNCVEQIRAVGRDGDYLWMG